MIVQCTSCRARFRVADEKVPPRGVRMRCTKCATVFKVTPDDALDATPRNTPDAVALPAPRHAPTPTPAAPGPASPPAASRPAAGSAGSASSASSADKVAPRLPQSYSLTYGAASPFAGEDDGEREQRPPSPRQPPPPPPARAAPGGRTPAASALDAALDAAMGSGSLPVDPFAEIASPPPPRKAPTPTPAYAAIDPFADSDPAHPPASPFGAPVGHGLPPPPLPQRRPPVGMPPPAGFPSAGSPPPPPPAMPPPPSYGAGMEPGQTPPQHGSPLPSAHPSPPPPAGAGRHEPSHPFGAREPTMPPALEPAPGANGPFGVPPSPGAGGTPMGRLSGSPEVSDPFATVDPAAGVMSATPRPARERTQPPPREPTATPLAATPSQEVVGLGRIRGGESTGAPEEAEEDPKKARRRKLRRDFVAALVNVASAAVVAFAALATVASIRSPTPLGLDDLGFPLVWLAFGFDDGTDADSLLVRDVKTGTYRTESGHELFWVRGRVENASAAGRAALYVMAEVVRGGEVLGTAESLARLDAGPEELRGLVSRRNVDLQKQLLAGEKSLHVKSKTRAPFVAVFPLSSRDVIGANVRLSVLEGLPGDLRPDAGPLVADAPAEDEAGDADEAGSGVDDVDGTDPAGDAVAGTPEPP